MIQLYGVAMWFYNQNQIQKMKINKKEFIVSLSNTDNPGFFIEKVIHPFVPQIIRRKLNVFYQVKSDLSFRMEADWF